MFLRIDGSQEEKFAMNRKKNIRLFSWQAPALLLVLLFTLGLGGCSSFGPRSVPVDRFDYNDAVSRSSSEQMLMNLVRLRYLDFPSFLAVTSIITSYTYEGKLGLGATIGLHTPDDNEARGDANLLYSERPTITYTPITGREFIRRLLLPIPASTIFAMAQSGWTVDLLLFSGINRINGILNFSFTAIPPPGEVELRRQRQDDIENAMRFQHLIRLLLVLEEHGIIEFQGKRAGKNEFPSLIIKRNVSGSDQALVDEFRSVLNLKPEYDTFRVIPRVAGRKANEITIQTRSLLAIMAFVSKGIDVPEEHRKQGWVEGGPVVDANGKRIIHFHVRSSATRPEGEYLSVKYRGYWFYIDQADMKSKRFFNYLLALFQLQSPATDSEKPLVTLPAG